MRIVLGLLRFWAAVFIFSSVNLLLAELPGAQSAGVGMAWADDDFGDDDDDNGNSNGGGSSGGGSSGAGSSGAGSSGAGSSGGAGSGGTSGAGSSGSTTGPSGSNTSMARNFGSEGLTGSEPTWNASGRNDSLVVLRSGSWNHPVHSAAVRGEILALDIGPAEIQALVQLGFRLVEQRNMGALGVTASRFSLPADRHFGAALIAVRRIAPHAIVAPNYVYRSAGHASPNACKDEGCYGPTLVGWEPITESCGVGIRIGMTDTAIDRTHPALRDRSLRTRTFDPFGGGSEPDHGTAVAGLLVGNASTGFPGMLPGAELFAADVFHTNDSGETFSTLLSLVQGLDWLVDSGVSVINVSMTGPPNALLARTVGEMVEQGIVVVAAAGNGGPAAPPAFPAAYDEVVSVTAVDQELRPYSMANRGAYISFSSPGVQIWSAGLAGSGQHRTGTSFAAAHASAIIADVIRQGLSADSHDAIQALQNDAQDLGVPGRDPIFGWGLIQGTPACQA